MTEGPRAYPAPRLLSDDDERGSFESRSEAQTSWLRNVAGQAHAKNSARVYVVTEPDGSAVVGYYAWCMTGISTKEAPRVMLKGAGRYPLHPVALLARLAVDLRHENRGIGATLLQDVVRRVVRISEQIGCLGLLIHAETEQAVEFYLRRIPEFDRAPLTAMHLVLTLADARKAMHVQ